MKAITRHVYGPPDVLELRDVEVPSIDDDQILVRVRASSVNPLDWHEVTGTPYLVRLQGGLRAPKSPIPGNDLAGEVETVGPSVTGLKVGDRVFGMGAGAFAEYVAVRETAVAPIPPEVSFEQAAASPIAALTALQALRKCGITSGQAVLVNGASGGVGTYAVQLAKWFGTDVTAVCSTRNLESARSLGADHVIDYTSEDFTRTGRRYDLILDIAGTRTTRDRRRALAPKGTLMMVGGPKTNRLAGPLFSLLRMMALSALGGPRMTGMLAKNDKQDLVQIAELLQSGALTSVIERTHPLTEVAEALRALGEGHARGKIVITI